jgi:hypothetical protein
VSTDAASSIPVRPQAHTAPPTADSDLTVPAGTHIALALRNAVDTKHSKEGDRIYLETIYPVAAGGRIAIPRGSFVNGTVTISKPAGRVKGKGELFIRFDSLTLPSGATRDFRSRLNSAEGAKVDREEGKVTGERDTGKDVGAGGGHDGDGRLARRSDRSRKGEHYERRRHRQCGGRGGGVGLDFIEEGSRCDTPSRHNDGYDSGSRYHFYSGGTGPLGRKYLIFRKATLLRVL